MSMNTTAALRLLISRVAKLEKRVTIEEKEKEEKGGDGLPESKLAELSTILDAGLEQMRRQIAELQETHVELASLADEITDYLADSGEDDRELELERFKDVF